MMCFRVRVGDAFDILEYLCLVGISHILYRWVIVKERRSNHIHALVCTLRREYHSHKKLVCCLELQFCGRAWLLTEIVKNMVEAFFLCHNGNGL